MSPGTRRASSLLGLGLGLLMGSVLPASALGQATSCSGAGGWTALVRDHLERYPAMELSDLYKLLHQSALGSEHAVEMEDARAWLDRELETLAQGPPEPRVDPLSPDGRFVRVHLRPFLWNGGDPEALLQAFVATADGGQADPGALRCALATVRELAEAGSLPWPIGAVGEYLAERTAEGYPAAHHSDVYVRHYRPAYRVVAKRFVAELVGQRRP